MCNRNQVQQILSSEGLTLSDSVDVYEVLRVMPESRKLIKTFNKMRNTTKRINKRELLEVCDGYH